MVRGDGKEQRTGRGNRVHQDRDEGSLRTHEGTGGDGRGCIVGAPAGDGAEERVNAHRFRGARAPTAGRDGAMPVEGAEAASAGGVAAAPPAAPPTGDVITSMPAAATPLMGRLGGGRPTAPPPTSPVTCGEGGRPTAALARVVPRRPMPATVSAGSGDVDPGGPPAAPPTRVAVAVEGRCMPVADPPAAPEGGLSFASVWRALNAAAALPGGGTNSSAAAAAAAAAAVEAPEAPTEDAPVAARRDRCPMGRPDAALSGRPLPAGGRPPSAWATRDDDGGDTPPPPLLAAAPPAPSRGVSLSRPASGPAVELAPGGVSAAGTSRSPILRAEPGASGVEAEATADTPRGGVAWLSPRRRVTAAVSASSGGALPPAPPCGTAAVVELARVRDPASAGETVVAEAPESPRGRPSTCGLPTVATRTLLMTPMDGTPVVGARGTADAGCCGIAPNVLPMAASGLNCGTTGPPATAGCAGIAIVMTADAPGAGATRCIAGCTPSA